MPQEFRHRKEVIIKQLAIPTSAYHDRSPKGSIDRGIRHLIDDINGQEGLVTTSSCAGRISVFLEGRKTSESSPLQGDETRTPSSDVAAYHGQLDGEDKRSSSVVASSGGKGGGGTWRYISHDPVAIPESSTDSTLHERFGLSSRERQLTSKTSQNVRYVHFKFEPMVGSDPASCR